MLVPIPTCHSVLDSTIPQVASLSTRRGNTRYPVSKAIQTILQALVAENPHFAL